IQIILSFLVIQQKDKRMVLIPFYVISMLTILSFMLSQIFLIITLVANNEFIYQQRLNNADDIQFIQNITNKMSECILIIAIFEGIFVICELLIFWYYIYKKYHLELYVNIS